MVSSIGQLNRPLTGNTTPGQSGQEINGNEGILHVPKNSKTGVSPSDGLVSF